MLYVSTITMGGNGNLDIALFDIDYMLFGGHILFLFGNMNGEFYDGDMAG